MGKLFLLCTRLARYETMMQEIPGFKINTYLIIGIMVCWKTYSAKTVQRNYIKR